MWVQVGAESGNSSLPADCGAPFLCCASSSEVMAAVQGQLAKKTGQRAGRKMVCSLLLSTFASGHSLRTMHITHKWQRNQSLSLSHWSYLGCRTWHDSGNWRSKDSGTFWQRLGDYKGKGRRREGFLWWKIAIKVALQHFKANIKSQVATGRGSRGGDVPSAVPTQAEVVPVSTQRSYCSAPLTTSCRAESCSAQTKLIS